MPLLKSVFFSSMPSTILASSEKTISLTDLIPSGMTISNDNECVAELISVERSRLTPGMDDNLPGSTGTGVSFLNISGMFTDSILTKFAEYDIGSRARL